MTRNEAIEGLITLVEVRRKYCDMQTMKDEIECLEMAIKALEQEPILDKIRAEIAQEYNRLSATRADETLELGECLGLKMSMKIIDKYKAESEDEE